MTEYKSAGSGSNHTAYKSKDELSNDCSTLESKQSDTEFALTTVQDAQYNLEKASKNIDSLMDDADSAIDNDGTVTNNNAREKAIRDTINIKNSLESVQHKIPSYNKLNTQEKNKARQSISSEIDKDTLIQSKLQIHSVPDIKEVDDSDDISKYIENGRLTPVGYAIVTDPKRLAELPIDLQKKLKEAYKNDPERKKQQEEAGLINLNLNKPSKQIVVLSEAPGGIYDSGE